jgi:hypothetical protein
MIVLKRQHVARNPVARAIAKQKLRESMLDMRIKFLMMSDGQDCREEVLTISDSIFVIACCYDMLGKSESVEFRKLKSSMNILTQCSETGFKWNPDWAITIDNAIDICEENWTKIPSTVFQKAMKTILG